MFVQLTKEQFEKTLPEGFEEVDSSGAMEYVYQIPTQKKDCLIRIFSSVDKTEGITRDDGKDSIKFILWDNKNQRPIGKGKRINRVEGKTTIDDRVKDRIADLMQQAENVNIIDPDYVKAILSSPVLKKSRFVNSLLESLDKYKSLTSGQLAYVLGKQTPRGGDTLETQVKGTDPNFLENYLNSLEEIRDESKEEGTEKEGEEVSVGDEMVQSGDVEPENSLGDDGKVELVPTSEFSYYSYPFENFNPVQSMVYPFSKDDVNMVISANTSAGKTIAAELLIDPVLETGKRVIYLSPLKALTQEKYDDWQKRFEGKEITILTGDYVLSEAMKKKLGKSQIIVMTAEMADSRSRRMKQEKNYWLMEVGLVICDESHIIGVKDRGHAVESGIMRFTKINPSAQIVFLSATMPNVKELGNWLTSLNGKETKIFHSTWRPVHLDIHPIEYENIINSWGRMDYGATQARKRSMVVDIAMSKPKEKFLIFVWDKTNGRQLIEDFKRRGEEVKFHNADEDKESRKALEDSFRDRTNGLRVMIATSTCAWGLTLPARNVIVNGCHRGINEIDPRDLVQASGRAGRYGVDDAGDVYLILPEGSSNRWMDMFINPIPVLSVMNEKATLAFHVISEIESREIKNARDICSWFQRSLAFMQQPDFMLDDAEDLLQALFDMQMIQKDSSGMNVQVTGLGRVASWLYFSPYDVYARYLNCSNILQKPHQDEIDLAWALANVPSYDLGYVPKELKDECEWLSWELRDRNIKPFMNIHMVLAAYKCLTGEDANGSLRTFMNTIRYDVPRVVQSMALTDSLYARWEKDKLWKSLATRVIYGIPECLVNLVSIPGVGAKRAKVLYDAGLKDSSDVSDPGNKPKIMKLFKTKLANSIIAGANSLKGQTKEAF